MTQQTQIGSQGKPQAVHQRWACQDKITGKIRRDWNELHVAAQLSGAYSDVPLVMANATFDNPAKAAWSTYWPCETEPKNAKPPAKFRD